MSVPIAEPTAPTLGARDRTTPNDLIERLSIPHFYLWLTAAAVAISALSLLFPSTPSYDPWSWLVWGREIEHLSLHTPGGPTWKPLPVIFTTLFAPFGSAQPNLWLIVARTGAVISCVMVFKLAARMTWWLRDSTVSAGEGWFSAFAPPALAGAIGMIGLALTGGFLSASTLGYSEGLMVAAVLIALERHLDGHRHQAFALGFVAALDRPEIWLFWGPYGLWLMWRDPSSRVLVVSLALATLFLWFVPQKWGGGSFTSGVARAQHPRANSAAFASCPFCEELTSHAWPQVLLRIKVAAALTVLTSLALLARGLRGRSGWALSGDRERAMVVLVDLRDLRARLVGAGGDRDAGGLLGQRSLPGARLGVHRRSPAPRDSAGRRCRWRSSRGGTSVRCETAPGSSGRRRSRRSSAVWCSCSSRTGSAPT